MPTGVYNRDNWSPWNKGKKGVQKYKPISKETRLKISLAKRGRINSTSHIEAIKKGAKRGLDHWHWKGGFDRREYYRNWVNENYQQKLFWNKRRRALKLDAEGTHTQEDWEALKAKYNFTCLRCRKQEPEIELTEDHIIPLTKKGSDYIENIQPLCSNCNSKKYNKIINYII